MAKTPLNFGHSECNRVKEISFKPKPNEMSNSNWSSGELHNEKMYCQACVSSKDRLAHQGSLISFCHSHEASIDPCLFIRKCEKAFRKLSRSIS